MSEHFPSRAQPRRKFLGRWAFITLCGFAVLTSPSSLSAAPSDSILQQVFASERLELVGRGTLRLWGLKVYEAELRAPDGKRSLDLFQQPFAMRIIYARDLRGRVIVDRTITEMKALGRGTPAQLKMWERDMLSLFPDVAAGDELTGIYRPGRGTEFFSRNRALGQIDDPEFSRAFFNIWLDPATTQPHLRRALLGTYEARSDS